MKNALKWLLSPAVLGTLAVLALSLLLWWIGPLVALGSGSDVWRPLDGFWTRVVVLALLWLAWLGRLAWKAWQRRRANALLAQGAAAGPSASDVEARALAKRFQDAVARLQAAPGAAGRSWLSSRRDGLYELPWYMFIGAPGSGKTTALVNAGLNFVLTDPAAGAAGAAAVKGVGGTRNCDWFFTQDAVLIDTAGRYTLQQSDASVDAAAWDKFLALLRKTRPRRPINGVLLTVNVQDLLQQSAAERSDHAERLRTRLQELQTKLGVRAPVYVLLTKADLIAGFTETFDALGKEGRDQVWGFSFDQAAPASGEAALQDFDTRYRALEERLVAGQLDRLQAERDVARRAAMFGFPQEFASLRPLLGGFLRQVFASAGGLQDAVLLRGVYFTSGTQEGTPIDRVMGLLSRSFGLERRPAALVGQHGKSFFLRRLLQDLVFAEAHLVSANPQAERRRTLLRGAGFATLAVAATALLVGWAVSHSRNRAHVDLVAGRVPGLKQALEALPPATSADPAPLAQPLAAVRHAAQPEGFALDAPPLLNTLGLYQGDKLDAGARLGYQRLLRHALLPRVAKRLEERLRAANKDNLEQAYEALKAYRMLYTPAQFDADALKAWISLDWDSQLASLPPEQRRALDSHLDALLALGAPQSGVQQDTALVASVRDMLASYPLEYRIYSRLRRQHRNAVPELALGAMAGPLADKVLQRVSGEPLARGVPGLYTRAGYAKAFQGNLSATAAQLASEAQWVLDQPAAPGGGARAAATAALSSELPMKVRRLYLQDYIVVWDKLLADVRLVDMKGQPLAAVADVARVLAGADSPLAAFYRAVAAETTLVPATPAAGAGPVAAAASAADQAKAALRGLADPTPAPASAGPVEKMVDDHFAPIRRLVAGQPSPLDDMAKAFAAVQAQLQAVDAAQKSKSAPPPPGGGAAAKAAVAQAPEAVRKMVDGMVDIAERGGHAALTGTMTGELKPVYDFCVRAIANRYPFATSSSADVLPDDFGQFFGPGGQLDTFFQARLASLVDTSGSVWTYKPGLDGTRPAAPAALADFQRAARIREAFFRSGGKAPGFRLDIKAGDLGGLPELVLDIDGQVSKLVANGPPVTVAWPSTRVASQVSLSGGGGQAGTTSNITTNGPWALFRLFDRFDVQPGPQPEKFSVSVTLDGKRARLDVTANSVFNPFRLREVQQFRCPGAL